MIPFEQKCSNARKHVPGQTRRSFHRPGDGLADMPRRRRSGSARPFRKDGRGAVRARIVEIETAFFANEDARANKNRACAIATRRAGSPLLLMFWIEGPSL
jgi:hypothetical protein